jgi:hypothetical protein
MKFHFLFIQKLLRLNLQMDRNLVSGVAVHQEQNLFRTGRRFSLGEHLSAGQYAECSWS